MTTFWVPLSLLAPFLLPFASHAPAAAMAQRKIRLGLALRATPQSRSYANTGRHGSTANFQVLTHRYNRAAEHCAAAVAAKGRFSIAFSGGSLPKLACGDIVNNSSIPWDKWDVRAFRFAVIAHWLFHPVLLPPSLLLSHLSLQWKFSIFTHRRFQSLSHVLSFPPLFFPQSIPLSIPHPLMPTPHNLPPLFTHTNPTIPPVKVFFVDERCVPLDHADSNYRSIKDNLLDKLSTPMPSSNVVTYDPSSSSPEEAATRYAASVNDKVPPAAGGSIPSFDLVLLGMGEDGHTASLFPGHALLGEMDKTIAHILDSPKPPPHRITFTYPLIKAAKAVAVVAAGAGKASLLSEILGGKGSGETYPVQRACDVNGDLRWFIDEPAASSLDMASLNTF